MQWSLGIQGITLRRTLVRFSTQPSEFKMKLFEELKNNYL